MNVLMAANGEREIRNTCDIRRRDIIPHRNCKRLRFKTAFVRRDRDRNGSCFLTDNAAIVIDHCNARVRRCDLRAAAGGFFPVCRCEFQRQRERIANGNFFKLVVCDFPRSRRLIVQNLKIIDRYFRIGVVIEAHINCGNGILCPKDLLLSMRLGLPIFCILNFPFRIQFSVFSRCKCSTQHWNFCIIRDEVAINIEVISRIIEVYHPFDVMPIVSTNRFCDKLILIVDRSADHADRRSERDWVIPCCRNKIREIDHTSSNVVVTDTMINVYAILQNGFAYGCLFVGSLNLERISIANRRGSICLPIRTVISISFNC